MARAYLGRDDEVSFYIKKNGTVLTSAEMGNITKIGVDYNGNYYDSISNAALFSIDDSTAKVTLYPGMFPGATTGVGMVKVIIFDAAHTDGFVWDTFSLSIDS